MDFTQRVYRVTDDNRMLDQMVETVLNLTQNSAAMVAVKNDLICHNFVGADYDHTSQSSSTFSTSSFSFDILVYGDDFLENDEWFRVRALYAVGSIRYSDNVLVIIEDNSKIT